MFDAGRPVDPITVNEALGGQSGEQLVALMEQAACNAIAETLEEGISTVGTQISVEHLSATPVGMRVWAEATLTAHESRSYDFTIEAFRQAVKEL